MTPLRRAHLTDIAVKAMLAEGADLTQAQARAEIVTSWTTEDRGGDLIALLKDGVELLLSSDWWDGLADEEQVHHLRMMTAASEAVLERIRQ